MCSMPELLSPAGSFECVSAAVQNGCTAVYAGASKLNARQNAKNLTLREFEKAVDYCHARGVRMYATANILIKDSEAEDFLEFAKCVYKAGADGIIVQDIGGASLIKNAFPDFYVLGSTQMTVHDVDGANFLYDNGINRIILARELNVKEVASICKNTDADIECFVHGALCVCYSGQCLMSSFIGGRSGNRGLCAQPCRHNYNLLKNDKNIKSGTLLSVKDLCGLIFLPKLIEAGIMSFKIEGRMKSPEYVAGVTSIYRKYIDMYFKHKEKYTVDENDVITLMRIFNRSGFTEGYFDAKRGKHMITENKSGSTGFYLGDIISYKNGYASFSVNSNVCAGDGIEIYADEGKRGAYITKSVKRGGAVSVKIENENIEKGQKVYRTYDKNLMDALKVSYSKDTKKIHVTGEFVAKHSLPVSLTVRCGDIAAASYGDEPEAAKSSPLTEGEAVKRITKTGGTTFEFKSINAHIDNNVFVTVSKLNDIRRNALAELENKLIKSFKRDLEKTAVMTPQLKRSANPPRLAVLVKTNEQLEAAMQFNPYRLYIDYEPFENMLKKAKLQEKYKCLPYIEREYTVDLKLSNDLYDGFLVRTYGQAARAMSLKAPFAADYTLNIFNAHSCSFWINKNCTTFCVSPELDESHAEHMAGILNSEFIVYGKIPVMTTSQCLIGNYDICAKNKEANARYTIASAKDKYDILTNCKSCYCQLIRQKPLTADIRKGTLIRIQFTDENYNKSKDVLNFTLNSFRT